MVELVAMVVAGNLEFSGRELGTHFRVEPNLGILVINNCGAIGFVVVITLVGFMGCN